MNTISAENVYPLVLLGGGHSHALWLKSWQKLDAKNPLNKIRPLLISENSNSPYSGMLPGLLSNDYTYEDCHIDLIRLCEKSQCDFLQRHCINITRMEHPDFNSLYRLEFKPFTENEMAFIYCEKLSINIGSQPTALISNSESGILDSKAIDTNILQHRTSWKVKPISQFYNNWHRLQKVLSAAKTTKVNHALEKPTINIIGAGAAGVEIACAIKVEQKNCNVLLISKSTRPLPSFSIKLQQLCLKRLNALQIKFIGEVAATENVMTEGANNFTILCTPSAAPQWLMNSDLSLSEHGFICVDKYLQTPLPGVFAAGDCAHFTQRPLPKAGVFAVRQADILFKNIYTQLSVSFDASLKPLTPFKPQTSFLSIINMGNQYALAQKGKYSWSGFLPWRYKHYIDKKFMDQFKQ